jgi:hypothetical protein
MNGLNGFGCRQHKSEEKLARNKKHWRSLSRHLEKIAQIIAISSSYG